MVNNLPIVKKKVGKGRERGGRLTIDWGVGMREGLGLVGHCHRFLYVSGLVQPISTDLCS